MELPVNMHSSDGVNIKVNMSANEIKQIFDDAIFEEYGFTVKEIIEYAKQKKLG